MMAGSRRRGWCFGAPQGSLLDLFRYGWDFATPQPFLTGADFSFVAQIGDEGVQVAKERSIIEEVAYRDTLNRPGKSGGSKL